MKARINAVHGGRAIGFAANRKGAMTLIEMLIGMAILAMTLAGFMRTFGMCERSVVAATAKITASNQARSQMETLTALSYNDASLSVGTHTLAGGVSYVITTNNTYWLTKDILVSVPMLYPVSDDTNVLTCSVSFASCIHP